MISSVSLMLLRAETIRESSNMSSNAVIHAQNAVIHAQLKIGVGRLFIITC